MAKDSIAAFLDTLDGSIDLREELGAALEGLDTQASAVVEVASRHGFEFTEDEFNGVLEVVSRSQGQELSDDELEAVAGGGAGVAVPMPEGYRRFTNLRLQRGLIFLSPGSRESKK
jgi:predicted ribosomally synthesized peptide with nif11-like leader